MNEFDIPMWVITATLVVVTYFMYRATKSVANATKEMSRTMIKPRPSIIHHKMVGEDAEHHHYQFIIKNQGLGDAFDVKINVFDKKGSSQPVPIPRLSRNQKMAFRANNIERSKNPVKIKIDYKDLMDYPYSDAFEYDIGNDVFFLQELDDNLGDIKFDE